MLNDQIRLHFGELNASEMRLARAIVGWHERELASIIECRDSACASLQRHYETLRSLAVAIWRTNYADEAPQWEPLPDIDGIVSQIDNMAAGLRQQVAVLKWEQAKLRTAADGLAEALERIKQGCQEDIDSWRDYPQHREAVIGGIGGNKAIAEAALAAYQATKPA